MTDFGSPQTADLIKDAIDSAFMNLHVCQPGIVQSYDDTTKTVSVLPAIRRPLLTEDGTTITEDLPVIQNVPVLVIGTPQISVEFELAKGDTVLLLFLDYSPAAWRGSGQVSDPPDLRKHAPAYPVAIPWLRPNGRASSDEKSTLGKPSGVRMHFKTDAIEVGGGSDFVAMAAKTDARLTALETGMTAHTHVVSVPITGPAGTTAGTSSASIDSGVTPGASTKSANLKAD